ncbi:MAG: hypothetical protein ACLBM1_07395 [Cuspidothrix sp.]
MTIKQYFTIMAIAKRDLVIAYIVILGRAIAVRIIFAIMINSKSEVC